MEDLKPDNTPPDFGTLAEIMERFREVPYEQFQKELQAWFEQGLKAQGRNTSNLADEGFPNLPELISRIYHQAEVNQTLSDNQITPNHDRP